jgi:hypothetical protein
MYQMELSELVQFIALGGAIGLTAMVAGLSYQALRGAMHVELTD